MKIEPLDRQTIKVVLSENDMQQLSITYDEMDYSRPQTRKIVLHLLQQVREETKLDFTKGKLFIEAFPYQEGGCILYLNLLQELANDKESPKGFNTPLIFLFEDVDELSRLCKKLFQRYNHLVLKSTLHHIKNKYILMIYSYYKLDDKLIAIIKEHADLVGKGEVKSRLVNEHADIILKEKAIETVMKYLC